MMSTRTPSDQELLSRFHGQANQMAFTELFQRYASLVFAACQRVLRDPHLAEDATNAAFLVLAKEAHTVSRDSRPIGAWLHRVATNVARDIWRRESRRRRREDAVGEAATSQPSSAVVTEQQLAQLHLEIEGLPEMYRTAIVLHDLEGRSYEAAAAALGWDRGVFGVRLQRGREMLRKRLVARGVGLGTEGVTGLFAEERATSVAVPATVVATLSQAAVAVAAGKTLTGLVSPQVAALTNSALKMLFWAKVKTAAIATAASVAVLVVGVLAVQQAQVHWPHATPAPRTAAADATGPQNLSPADAWIRALLARAEAGPWDAVDFGQGACAVDEWRMDARGTPAERLIWNTHADAQNSQGILFDTARWKRGVVTGRIMLLTDRQSPPATPPDSNTTNPRWYLFSAPPPRKLARPELAFNLYTGELKQSEGKELRSFETAREQAGAWCRIAIYFDTEVEGGPAVWTGCWPETAGGPPPVSEWFHYQKATATIFPLKRGDPVGLGLRAYDARIQVRALKLVPLGPDFPQPPASMQPR